VAQGKIPYRRIHSLIRFEKDAIERWIESFCQSRRLSLPTRRMSTEPDLDALIEAAKRDAYTARHGETLSPSPTRKENENGAR
ncbi:MAG TPA: DNA-binding protein, partial [Nitrospiraceae bacterium]|nr:DNA-binding protein [Nitrospiraceae bacterium]